VKDGVPEAVVVLDAADRPIARGRTGGRGGTWTCRYYANLAGELPDASAATPVAPTEGQYVALVCFDDAGQITHTDALFFTPADPLAGIGAAYRAMEIAREQIVLLDPQIATSPPATTFQLVGLPTYLTVGPAWATATQTATVGPVSSTVTATPTQVTWDPGDGSGTITCPTGGSTTTAACTHTYVHSSSGQPAGTCTLTATITWDVSWTSTTGEGGELGPVTRTASIPLTVQQAQAVID
jgi:hypothetical protein